MKDHLSALALMVIASSPTMTNADGAVARCGASQGQGYFFHDSLTNPEGPKWMDDGNSNGQIILIRLGQEWDIQFNDFVGASGYRSDGAVVVPLANSEQNFRIGAFHSNYSDIYTFDAHSREVVWTSHKIGPIVPKVGIYKATCSFLAADIFVE